MEGKYEYEVRVGVGLIHDRTDTIKIEDLGFDREEWDALSDEERKSELNAYVEEWATQYIEYGWD